MMSGDSSSLLIFGRLVLPQTGPHGRVATKKKKKLSLHDLSRLFQSLGLCPARDSEVSVISHLLNLLKYPVNKLRTALSSSGE